MAEFLLTKAIGSNLERIIFRAKKELVLISPYLQLSEQFYNRLIECNDIPIRIVYGKSRLAQNQWDLLKDIQNLELFYYENLHAKCFYNESEMIIGSMNFYEFSENNNREMGILINSITDVGIYEDAKRESESIIRASERKLVNFATQYNSKRQHRDGYCIRCQATIKYDPLAPYCRSCYGSWANWGDEYYTERCCHGCGKVISTISKKAPQCHECFKLNPVYP